MKVSKGISRVPTEASKRKTNKRWKDTEKLHLNSDLFGLGSFVSPNELTVEIGDLIQIDRVLYTEWSLYAGNGNVVNLCSLDCENEISADDFATVKLSSLAAVAGTSGVRVNNKIVGAKDRHLEQLPVEKVIQSGMDLVGQEVKYNLLTRNSEHYVTEWKYGQGWSDQASVTMNVMRTLSADSSIGHSVLANSLNAVLNSPAIPVGRSLPTKFDFSVNKETPRP